MENYKELIKKVEKDPDFIITKNSRKATIKVTYVKSGRLYSVHPGENAVQPLKSWMKKIKENN